jgi:tetratricopeptide (TPR) repeat protein
MHAGFAARLFCRLFLLLALGWTGLSALSAQPKADEVPAGAAPAAGPAETPTPASPDDGLAAAARLIESLRAQQEASQRTIESLQEQAATARHQAEVTSARLKLIEMTLSERHERELASLQAANRLTLTVIAVVAGVSLLALAVMAFFLFRATNRLAGLPQTLAPLPAPGDAADTGGRRLLAGTTSAEVNARLLSVVGLLEKKFGDLEHAMDVSTVPETAGGSTSPGSSPAANGSGKSSAPENDRVRGLLARGQKLLEDEDAAQALTLFEEAVALDPRNTDALVKRGKALEKLGQMEEALRSYDQALAIDGSLTIAHLSKGGVFNRLDRFGEALECYERALQAQAAATAVTRS